MASKEEKQRRASLLEAIDEIERANTIKQMPLSFQDLAALFDYLDEKLDIEGCDHTPKMTRVFLENRKLDAGKILPWLEAYGGYCDCEVLANVEDSWDDEIKKNT